MSLDGFLAGENDDISWLEMVNMEGEDYGYFDFIKTVDTYIVGRKTYEVVTKLLNGKFPQADQFKCYVITTKDLPEENGVEFYNGDVKMLIDKIQSEEGKDIYCDGGGKVVQLLLQQGLIDELIISVIPIILGKGKRLFLGDTPSFKLKALPTKHYDSGLIQLRYEKKEQLN